MYGSGTFGGFTYGGDPNTATFPVAGPSERIFFLDARYSDLATLATGATAAMPVVNLQDMHPAKKWRSSRNYDNINITLAVPVAATALALVGHNFSSAGMWRIRAFNSAADMAAETNVVYDSAWSSVWPLGIKPADSAWPQYLSLKRWASVGAFKYWRVDLADTGSTYIEAGRLVLGVSFQLSFNFDFGSAIGLDPTDIVAKSEFGSYYTDARSVSRTFDLKFSAAEWREAMDWLMDTARVRGISKDVVCCLDPASTTDFHRFSLQGLISSPTKFATQAQFSGTTGSMLWTVPITLAELLY